MEALLLIADALDRLADHAGDLVLDPGRPVAGLVHDPLAADFAGEDDLLRRHQGLAGDPGLGVLGEEQVDDGVGNLVGDLVGVAFGHGFGGEEVAAAHR